MILAIEGVVFIADEVPEQAEVSSFFLRRLKILCLHVLAPSLVARENRDGSKIITPLERYKLMREPFNLPNYRSQKGSHYIPTVRSIRHTASPYL